MKLDEETQKTIIAETANQIGWKIQSSSRNMITGELHINFVEVNKQIRFKPILNSDKEEFYAQLKTLLSVYDTDIETEIENLRSNSPDNVYSAMQILQRFGESAVAPLIQALLDPTENFLFRSRVAGTLAMIGDSRAIQPLIQSIKTSDVEFRWSVVKALGEIGDETAIPYLENLEKTDNGSFNITDYLKVTIKEAATEAKRYIEKRIK